MRRPLFRDRMLRPSLLGLALFLAACALPANAIESACIEEITTPAHLSPDDAAALRAETLAAFRESDFEALDRIAARLRATLPRTADGGQALDFFYESFAPDNLALPRDTAAGLLENWSSSPGGNTSPTRAVATALYWRKQDPRNATPESRATWARARSAALKNDLPNDACPHLALERHRRLTSRESDRVFANALHAEASAAFPGYAPLIEGHAGWLGGFADAEVGPWLAAETDKLPASERDEVYAMVAISRPRSSYDWIARRRLDWPRIQRGLLDFHVRWPDAPGTLDKLALAAESHDDRVVLRRTLLRIEAHPHRATWSDNKGAYLRARRKAGLEAPSDLTPLLTRDLELRGYRVAFSPDGATVVVGCAKGEILAFATTDLRPLWQLKCSRWISSLAFSPDGRFLAASGGHLHGKSGGAVWVWDAHTRERLAADETLTLRLQAVAFAPDSGSLWATGGVDRTGLLLHWAPGESAFTRLPAEHTPPGFGQALAVGPDAVYVSARRALWRLAPANLQGALTRLDNGKTYHALALSPDTRLLATGGWENNEAWDTPATVGLLPLAASEASPVEQTAPLPALGNRIETLAFSRDASLLVAASSAADFQIWNLPSGGPRLHAYVDDAWTIDDLALSPDATRIATVDTSGKLRLWLIPPATGLRQAPPTGPRWPVK